MLTTKTFYTVFTVLFLSLQLCAQIPNWNETDKIVASDRQVDAFFGGLGSGSKEVSIHGDYAVVGAERNDHSGLTDAGAAYIYKKNSLGGWDFQQKLIASNPQANAFFGSAVAISEYEGFIVIGSSHYDYSAATTGTILNSGTAYLFKRNAFGTWVQVEQLYPTLQDREVNAYFGASVDITVRRVIVGALGESSDPSLPTASKSGAAYIFQFNGGILSWNLTQKLTASDRSNSDLFGLGVAIHENYAVIGAPGNTLDDNGNNPLTSAGAAYVFEKTGPNPWSEVHKLVSTDRGSNEGFGRDVDIDYRTLIIGCKFDQEDGFGNNPIVGAGSAFIYRKNALIAGWTLENKIVASDRQENDLFGQSVGIDGIGYAVVGSILEDHDANGNNFMNIAGSAYIYKYDDSSITPWSQDQKIVASDRSANDDFGSSVSIDETNIIVTAHSESHDENGGNFILNAGSAYIYETAVIPFTVKSTNDWIQEGSSSDSHLTVFPNPSTGKVQLSISDFDESENYELIIYDSAGKAVFEEIVSSEFYQFDLGEQENGLYILQVRHDSSIQRLKLLITK
ncbi:MAG: T9SS type A sorting domain-containing protein [Crocinitomicaceae bacterium]